jgi:voltage-gated potassium channel
MDEIESLVFIRSPFEKFLAWREQNKFLFLLVTLVLLLIIYPVLEDGFVGDWSLKILTTILLVIAVYAVSDTRRKFIAALVLSFVPLIAGWLYVLHPDPVLSLVANASTMVFFTVVTVTILHSVLVSGSYSLDTVFGGICIYLLIGFTYGTGFYLLHALSPGAFYPDPVPGSDQLLSFSEFLFYSFSTLTTLGYGNVIPLTSQARTMVLFEAVSGVIYVAVLIAWLVGSVTTQLRKK